MARFGLFPGAWTGAVGLIFGGSVELLGAGDEQEWIRYISWGAIALGALVILWGVTVNGRQWWRREGPNSNGTEATLKMGKKSKFQGSVNGDVTIHNPPPLGGGAMFENCEFVDNETAISAPKGYSLGFDRTSFRSNGKAVDIREAGNPDEDK